MTRWQVLRPDLPASPGLNLSGGVGGDFGLKYVDSMQTWLHDYLQVRRLRYLSPGRAVVAPACGSPFLAVAHAMAIDAFYDTVAQPFSARKKMRSNNWQNEAAPPLLLPDSDVDAFARLVQSFTEIAKQLFARNDAGVESFTLATTNFELFATIQQVLWTQGVRSAAMLVPIWTV